MLWWKPQAEILDSQLLQTWRCWRSIEAELRYRITNFFFPFIKWVRQEHKMGHVRRNTEQDGAEQSPGNSARRFLRALLSHILVGPGEEKLDDLTCVHAIYLLFLFSFVSVTSSLYYSVIRRNIERELNGCTNTGEKLAELVPRCRDEMASAESITLRLGFSVTVTFFSLSLLTLKSPPNGLRARIHQGF